MITIRMKKGLDLNVAGRPEENHVSRLMDMDRVGVSPVGIPHIKPKLRVKVDDRVKQGDVLFTDKRNSEVAFVSPGGGTVKEIDFGPRRVIRAIVIQLDKEEERRSFGTIEPHRLATISRKELIRHLMSGGLWPFIRALPFRDFAEPDVTPPAIIVNLDSLDIVQAGPSIYMNGSLEAFFFGLDALKKLAPEIYVVTCHETDGLDAGLAGAVTHRVSGKYPADDPGVFLYYTRASTAANRCWFVHGRDVLLLGRFLSRGVFPVERLVSVYTPDNTRHVLTRAGAPVSLFTPEANPSDGYRTVSGGLWRGAALTLDDYLGFYDSSVAFLPTGGEPEFFGFMRPGWRKPSRSRAFLSAFNKKPFPPDTGQHGEERACVNCGSCTRVCPVDILPQFTVKSILAGEVEESLAHGLLDCVECGLCTYVCPAKIELNSILRKARKDYYKEVSEP